MDEWMRECMPVAEPLLSIGIETDSVFPMDGI